MIGEKPGVFIVESVHFVIFQRSSETFRAKTSRHVNVFFTRDLVTTNFFLAHGVLSFEKKNEQSKLLLQENEKKKEKRAGQGGQRGTTEDHTGT